MVDLSCPVCFPTSCMSHPSYGFFLVPRQKWTLNQVSKQRSNQLGATHVAQMCNSDSASLWSFHSDCEIFLLFLHLYSPSSSPLLPKYLTLSLNNWIHCWIQGEVCTSFIITEDPTWIMCYNRWNKCGLTKSIVGDRMYVSEYIILCWMRANDSFYQQISA